MENDIEIPPVAKIRTRLGEFEMRVPVWGLTVFTVDGYIIAHKLFYEKMPVDLEMAVSTMSAGLITISENFIQMIDQQNKFKQVLVDALGATNRTSFSILLKHICDNVMLTCIFPHTLQLGLVSFEIENLSNEILEIVREWDVKLHSDTVT